MPMAVIVMHTKCLVSRSAAIAIAMNEKINLNILYFIREIRRRIENGEFANERDSEIH